MNKHLKISNKLLLGGVLIFAITLLLSGCSVTIGENELTGINVIWTPFVFIWDWLWNSFTPGYWAFVELIWDLPAEVAWLASIVVYILSVVLYAIIVVVIVVLDNIIAIITGIIWFILSILNGFIHFV